MQDKLAQIDTEPIDELARVKQERDRIHRFRERAEDKKDEVDEEIYRRVIADYERREQALDEEAAPLQQEGRAEYRKLASILSSVTGELDDARSRQQELVFRHEVGEIDDAELKERLEEPEAVIARCEESLEELGQLRDRFVEAFGSEEALEEPDEEDMPPEPAEEEPVATETGPESVSDGDDETRTRLDASMEDDEPVDATRLAGAALESPAGEEPGAEETHEEAPSPEATVVADPSMFEADQEEAPSAGDAQETMVVPSARLLLRDGDDEAAEEFFLGPVNYVGRAPDNHVCVEAPAVSRKHALVSAGADGFVIEDLGSPNGTFVNDEKIEGEHRLQDGDEIKLGNVELSFRSP